MHGHPVLTEMKWISLQRTLKWLLQTNWKLTIDICDLVYAFEGRNNDVYNLKNVILFSTYPPPILLHLHHVRKKTKQKNQNFFLLFFSFWEISLQIRISLEFHWCLFGSICFGFKPQKKKPQKKPPNPNRSVFIVHKAHIDKIDNNLIVSLHSTSLLKMDIWKL